jgi:hypothetical protein
MSFIHTVQKISKKPYFFPVLLLVIYLGYQVLSIPHTGMTWDEPSSFFFGRANERFWQTRNSDYIEKYNDKELFQYEPIQFIWGEHIYPPFALMMFAITSSVFAETIPLFSVVDAHHLGEILFSLPGLLAFYFLCRTAGFSRIIAFLTTLIYITYPTISNQVRSDAKDVPLMSMIVLFIFCFVKWTESIKHKPERRHVWGIFSAISLGLMVGTKVSGGIMIPIVGLYVITIYILNKQFRKGFSPLLFKCIELCVLSVIALVIFVISWPWLWSDIIGKLTQVWGFFKVVGLGMPTLYFGNVYQAGITLPWHYPFGILVAQTPPSLWLLVIPGMGYALWRVVKKRDTFAVLLFFWLLIGFGRFFVPGVIIYAKIRHFIDAMPPFFFFAGYGAWMLSKCHYKFISGKVVSTILLGIVFMHQVIIIVTHFPYEASYFSFVAGGTKNVAVNHLFDIEYWASSVKEGMEGLDRYTDKETTVYACTMAHLAKFYETDKVKVKLTPWEAEYIIIPNSYSWFGGPAEHAKENHKLVYTVERNGAPFLWVYKFDTPTFWNCGTETEMNYTF